MQACTDIHGFTSCIVRTHKKLLVHNILIHFPAEGKGDHGRKKVHWKDSQTLVKPLARRQTRIVQWQADSKFVYVIIEGYPKHFILTITFDEQIYVCRCIENYI